MADQPGFTYWECRECGFDSVNLGSNPSSPATTSTDVSGTSRIFEAAERSEQREQIADTGRTEVGTASAARYRAEIARLNRTTDREIDAALTQYARHRCASLLPQGGRP